MKLGSLFAGIGGFELAATWAGIEPVWSNEIDLFACKVLRKNFDHEIIQKDIREIGKENLQPVDIISGGDPCQPHSTAGLGKGEKDDRFLWPEMFRIICELHPTWIVNENVGGSISNGVLDRKIIDLENEGYTWQAYDIPAEAIGALHRRQRIWLVANDTRSNANNRASKGIQKASKGKELQEQYSLQHPCEPVNLRVGITEPETFKGGGEGYSSFFGFGNDTRGNFTQKEIESGIIRELNGLPKGMDYADRNKRIKGLGNAIVPQVAYEIFKAIKTEL